MMTAVGRRKFLGAGLAFGFAATGPAFIWGCVREGNTGAASDAQRAMLKTVADLVIPATDTPSASTVGVPAFVELALLHGLDGTGEAAANGAIPGGGPIASRDGGGTYLLAELENLLDKAADGSFAAAQAARRHAILAGVDAAAFAENGHGPWRKIKDLILIGYYNSEVGASKELAYELVPGRFDPDVPMTAATRAFSSDWTARDFG